DPDFDRLEALAKHRARLEAEAERYRRLVGTIDRTIAELERRGAPGEGTMKHADLYEGFAPEKQEEYERWLIDRYGGDMRERIDQRRAMYGKLSEAEKAAVMQQLAEIETDLAEGCRRKIPVDSPALEPVLERHRGWVSYMWDRPCPGEAYAGLADLYAAHPDFRERYERLEPGFTEYLVSAMKAHAERIA